MKKTLFEEIANRKIPSFEIWSNDDIFVFLDINPNNPGHSLIIPKNPYPDIYEIPTLILEKLFLVVQKVSVAIKEATKADGIKIVMNNGRSAGQKVFHAHVHVIPFFENKNFGKNYKYKEGEAEILVNKIKACLREL